MLYVTPSHFYDSVISLMKCVYTCIIIIHLHTYMYMYNTCTHNNCDSCKELTIIQSIVFPASHYNLHFLVYIREMDH